MSEFHQNLWAKRYECLLAYSKIFWATEESSASRSKMKIRITSCAHSPWRFYDSDRPGPNLAVRSTANVISDQLTTCCVTFTTATDQAPTSNPTAPSHKLRHSMATVTTVKVISSTDGLSSSCRKHLYKPCPSKRTSPSLKHTARLFNMVTCILSQADLFCRKPQRTYDSGRGEGERFGDMCTKRIVGT